MPRAVGSNAPCCGRAIELAIPKARAVKNILCVFGTRPEAVKMAPVILALRARSTEFRCRVVLTAQHREMLDQVMSLFSLQADHDLNVMTEGQSLSDVTVRVLERMGPVLDSEKPDLVLVHGDTTTTLAAALAAFYQKVSVGHVEAGLRSYDLQNPFPEEMNRRVADTISSLHFAPTDLARRQLLAEGVSPEGIFVTGNSGIDALHLALARFAQEGTRRPAIIPSELDGRPYVLITAHRRENFGAPLAEFCGAVAAIAKSRPEIHFVYPVHPNPQVQGPVRAVLDGRPNVHLLPPLEYGDLLFLLKGARFVLTDSGGLQEEAPALGKPVLVLRKVTERPEAVKAGTARVIGTDARKVRRWILRLLDEGATYHRMANAVNPYGDGRAAERTVEGIRYFFGLRRTRPGEFRAERRRIASNLELLRSA